MKKHMASSSTTAGRWRQEIRDAIINGGGKWVELTTKADPILTDHYDPPRREGFLAGGQNRRNPLLVRFEPKNPGSKRPGRRHERSNSWAENLQGYFRRHHQATTNTSGPKSDA